MGSGSHDGDHPKPSMLGITGAHEIAENRHDFTLARLEKRTSRGHGYERPSKAFRTSLRRASLGNNGVFTGVGALQMLF